MRELRWAWRIRGHSTIIVKRVTLNTCTLCDRCTSGSPYSYKQFTIDRTYLMFIFIVIYYKEQLRLRFVIVYPCVLLSLCNFLYCCVLLCTIVHHCVLLCTVMYFCVFLCTVVYFCAPLCTVVYFCVLLCTFVHHCVLLCTFVYLCVLLFTFVYRCISVRTVVYCYILLCVILCVIVCYCVLLCTVDLSLRHCCWMTMTTSLYRTHSICALDLSSSHTTTF